MIELVNLPVVLILLVTEGDMKELMASGRGVYFLVGVNFVVCDVNDVYVFSWEVCFVVFVGGMFFLVILLLVVCNGLNIL